MKLKLVVLTGAGMSAESGIKTFRDSGGLWEGYDVMEVASIDGWRKNQALVLDFYNQRRRQLFETTPNKGHLGLAALQNDFDVHIVTQNVDDLHERAGSKKILHLHGELRKVKSTSHPELIYTWDKDLNIGDKCEKGSQLRPHIVWFGEMVPALEEAKYIVAEADILVVIGTSMVVYPAASLIHYAKRKIPKFIIDPKIPEIEAEFFPIECGASEGVEKLIQFLNVIKSKKEG
jgi:NAD-dependent deacetylase